MCAIIGYLGKHIDQDAFNRARDTLSSRGPDDAGSFFHAEDKVALGNRRLSIIDLSSTGHQPMISHDNRYVITFNGEIFNYIELKKELQDYPFRSSSDTEVLLAAFSRWGKDCLHKLNGQFAFAVYDTEKRELFCARDHVGIKPFFYTGIRGAFAFASEIKALLAFGAKAQPNDKIIQEYLRYGLYDHSAETFFDGIRSLPAGYYLTYKDGRISVRQYWDLARLSDKSPEVISDNEAAEHLRTLIEDAIRLQFRSDVPIGISLSSGLDSAALYYFSKKIYPADLRLFTAGIMDKDFNECAILKERLSKSEQKLWHTSSFVPKQVFQYAEEFLTIQDQPYGGMSCLNIFNLYKEINGKTDVKVIIEGQGMDELLAGYPHYVSNQNSEARLQLPRPFSSKLLNDQYQDIKFIKIPRTLRYKDHLSMAFSKEVRVPFLDKRIVEFCFGLPEHLKIQNGLQKFILREALRPYLPDAMRENPKVIFTAFQTSWFRKYFVGEVHALLNSESFKSRPYFDHEVTKRRIDDFFRGEGDNSFFLWQLINLEMWLRRFID